jgi:translation initiation factor 3 subunit D
MTFKLPDFATMAEQWGPSLTSIPERFQDIPYAPYSKADKLGRVADWYEQQDEPTKPERRHDHR